MSVQRKARGVLPEVEGQAIKRTMLYCNWQSSEGIDFFMEALLLSCLSVFACTTEASSEKKNS
jgi:hypothetical protein